MPDARDPDLIRLSLPADRELRGVVEVAAGVLARRLRFGDEAIADARAAAGAAFDEVVGAAGQTTVEVELLVTERRLVLQLRGGDATRTVTIPEETSGRPG